MKISTSHKISHGSIALRILLPTLLGGLLAVCQASADRSVRCEGRIVSIGTFKEEVREKCGTPDHLEEWEEGQSTVISEYYDYEKERYILPRFIPGKIKTLSQDLQVTRIWTLPSISASNAPSILSILLLSFRI
ncbi:MAG: DUF2845 domain-containing protein [Desulfobacterales bacterium]|nr:DUF2845 domain-containing protein [Desulfobacterales bacterium]